MKKTCNVGIALRYSNGPGIIEGVGKLAKVVADIDASKLGLGQKRKIHLNKDVATLNAKVRWELVSD